MLAYRIEVVDRRAGGQQEPCRFLLFRERDRRNRPGRQCRAASRDEEHDEVVGFCGVDTTNHLFGRGLPARVWHGMAGLSQDDMLRRHGVTVLDDDEALGDRRTERALERRRHRTAGLATTKDEELARKPTRQIDGQTVERAVDEGWDIGGGERRAPDCERGLAGRLKQTCAASVGALPLPSACRRSSENRSGSSCVRARYGRRTTSP